MKPYRRFEDFDSENIWFEKMPDLGPSAAQFVALAQACRRCSRMDGVRRVIGPKNGDWNAEVMFVGEAPGRLGAERTGIPFFGDVSGERFEQILSEMGLHREEVFVTNAVLCNPLDEIGRNARPTRGEIENCRPHLREAVRLVDPRFVVALGRVALNALARIDPHALDLSDAGQRLFPWSGRHLAVLFHPSPRSAVHRKWDRQQQDARRLGRRIHQARKRS